MSHELAGVFTSSITGCELSVKSAFDLNSPLLAHESSS